MCGIVGIWNRGGAPAEEGELVSMRDTLSYRGPDDAGVYVDESLGLGHRRLSIIDVSEGGHQPMTDPTRRYTLCYNGELYNYQELKEGLTDINWQTESDTEVFLQLLIQHGPQAFAMARGMFALAFWDKEEQTLLLARDPFGKKPLVYTSADRTVLFASEPKALLAHAAPDARLNVTQLGAYLLHEYAPAPETLLEGIRHVPAGSYMQFTLDGESTERYWQPSFMNKIREEEDVVLTQLDELLGKAVERRLVSDVPVGLLLSGGLDSTTVGWYIRQAGKKLHSFSISFDEESFDESSFAQQAATELGFEHHEEQFTIDEFKVHIGELQKLMDMPLADASLLPTYQVSKLARKHVTVVLDGDGADELLGGYGTFRAAEVADRLLWQRQLKRLIAAVVGLLPTHHTNFSFDFKASSFARGLGEPLHRRNQLWLGSLNEDEVDQVLTRDFRDSAATMFAALDTHARELDADRLADKVSGLTISGYLENDILVKLDRATMYTSVEARTPFLDIDLAEFVMQLPTRYKRDKYILRKLMRGRIPDSIIDRKKKGFGIPLGLWLKGPLKEWAQEVLTESKVDSQAIFNSAYISQLFYEHGSGKADHRKKLWTLISFQLWYEEWIAPTSNKK